MQPFAFALMPWDCLAASGLLKALKMVLELYKEAGLVVSTKCLEMIKDLAKETIHFALDTVGSASEGTNKPFVS